MVTRDDVASISVPWEAQPLRRRILHYYGTGADHVAGPTRPVIGVVQDEETGRPLAGFKVRWEYGVGNPVHPVETVTDDRGRFRLTGLPIGKLGGPMLAPSQLVARLPMAAPAFVFIDGGHSMPAALADWQNWGARVMQGGLLAIHDVFPNTADGGRPPHEIYKLALHSGLFREELAVKSLRVLRRV